LEIWQRNAAAGAEIRDRRSVIRSEKLLHQQSLQHSSTPLTLWGSPDGVGKSQIVRQMVANLGYCLRSN
jgi:ABC-type iron transport system FetAB ATPase subunit